MNRVMRRNAIGLTKTEDSIPRLIIICEPGVSVHDEGYEGAQDGDRTREICVSIVIAESVISTRIIMK